MTNHITVTVSACSIGRAACLAMATLTFVFCERASAQDVDNGDFKIDPGLALTKPDEFNWSLLVGISKKAPPNLQFPAGANTTNNAVWETWADDQFTFPRQPDPANPPKWEDRNKPLAPQPITQLQLRLKALRRERAGPQPEAIIPGGGGEVVFRNKSSFDFIVKHNLFYQEGLAAAFKQGVNPGGFPSGVTLQFDLAAVELKAVYQLLGGALTKENCHWNYAADGKAYGLVALHIMSKQIPNWTWATWEWSGNTPDQPNGNPGRSDWYGSRDSFGAIYKDASGAPTHFQAPAADQGKPYPSGSVTAELIKMFKDAGFSEEWQQEWSNYRLKGSQIDFTDSTGAAVLVGNSVTENGFVQTSSCMTCHGNAGVDSTGAPNPSIGFTLDGQSRNGPLDPAWFYDLNNFDPAQQFGRYKVIYYPIDFIWAIFKAHPKKR
jgi:hypothetical protein